MAHYTNHSVQIQDDLDATPVTIGSISQIDTPIENDVQYSETAGTYYPENISVAMLKPNASLTTFDIKKIWDALGLIGRSVVEGSGKPGVAIYQALYNDSAIGVGSVHRRLRFPKAYINATRLSVAHRQDATIDVAAQAIWDQSSDPVLIEATQPLPTLPTSPGRWTIHSVTIGGTAIGCPVNVDIDFGITATSFGCASDLYDSKLNLDSIQPRISITGLDPTAFAAAAIPLLGKAGTHANTTIILRKRATSTAGFVADATAEHIEITAAGTSLVTNAHNATGNQRSQTQIEIYPRYDGTNAPIIIDTAFAIP